MEHKTDLTMMYAIRDGLYAIKKEMDERGLTFEEFIECYEKVLQECERQAHGA